MLTHVDNKNNPGMVDVGDKRVTSREALAESLVVLPPELAELFRDGDYVSKKGPVFHTAIVAGTMAAKKCHELIPFCHPLPIDSCKLELKLVENSVQIRCLVRVRHKTGVEMEALTGASVAALTVYDMCKAVTQDMVIQNTRLLTKSGGRHDISKI